MQMKNQDATPCELNNLTKLSSFSSAGIAGITPSFHKLFELFTVMSNHQLLWLMRLTINHTFFGLMIF